MASVWLALDVRLDRWVAIKVLGEALAQDQEYLRRFEREARLAAKLSHPNLVRIYDFGTEEGRPFLISEWIDGSDLHEMRRDGVPVELEPLAADLLSALDYIHGAGIVHRDVKPSNLIMGSDGRARLTDFGIAQAGDTTRLTDTGLVIGTRSYIAPEVMAGGRATPRSDLYSAGVLLSEYFEQAGEVPQRMRTLVARLTAKDPARRPSSAGEAALLLDGARRKALERRPITPPGGQPTQEQAQPTPTGVPTPPADQDPTPTPPTLDEARRKTPVPPSEELPAREPAPMAEPRDEEPAPAPAPPSAARAPNRLSPTGLLAIGLLVAAIAAAIAIGIVSSGDEEAGNGGPATAQDESGGKGQPSAGTEPPAGPIPPPNGTNDPAHGADRQLEGHDLLAAGDAEGAIPVLEEAIASYPAGTYEALVDDPASGNIEYAYALYDLGVALAQAGRPEEAIPVLKARAKIDDQRDTVKQALKAAKAQAG